MCNRAQNTSILTLGVANAQVHHGSRQVPRAAATAQVGIPSGVLRVQRRGEGGRKLKVAEVRQGAAGTQRALIVGQTGVLLRRREDTVRRRGIRLQ